MSNSMRALVVSNTVGTSGDRANAAVGAGAAVQCSTFLPFLRTFRFGLTANDVGTRIEIQAGNDGTTWQTIDTFNAALGADPEGIVIDDNSIYYRTLRIAGTSACTCVIAGQDVIVPSAGASDNAVVYREGAVAPQHPVYDTFVSALAACVTYGGPSWLAFDDSLGTPFIPAGAHVIPEGCTLTGLHLSGGGTPYTTVDVQDLATLTGRFRMTGGLNLRTSSTAPVIVDPIISIEMDDFSGFIHNGAAPTVHFIVPPAAGDCMITMDTGARMVGNGVGKSCLAPDVAVNSCQVNMGDATGASGTPFAGAGAIQLLAVSPSAVFPAALPITVTLSLSALALVVGFAAAAPNWAAPLPTEVDTALGQLRAAAPRYYGNDTLVGGASPAAIPALGISAASVIVPIPRVPTPGAGNLTNAYVALEADRDYTPGAEAFKITAVLADGTINVLDTSKCDYLVIL